MANLSGTADVVMEHLKIIPCTCVFTYYLCEFELLPFIKNCPGRNDWILPIMNLSLSCSLESSSGCLISKKLLLFTRNYWFNSDFSFGFFPLFDYHIHRSHCYLLRHLFYFFQIWVKKIMWKMLIGEYQTALSRLLVGLKYSAFLPRFFHYIYYLVSLEGETCY